MPRSRLRVPLGLLAMVAAPTGELPGQSLHRIDEAPRPAAAATAPLRLVGHFPGWLERIAVLQDGTAVLTLLVGPMRQPIDRGDEIRLRDPTTGQELTTATVVTDTRADMSSGRAHVRVRLAEPNAAARLAELAPANRTDMPTAAAERDAIVRAHGPEVTVLADFAPEDGDAFADFVEITARGACAARLSADAVLPECCFTLRFREPVDVATLNRVQLSLAGRADATTALVPMRASAVDEAGTVFRFEPPLGLACTPRMRADARDDRARPAENRRPHYLLRIADGDRGLRAASGRSLAATLELPLTLDPAATDNLVGWRTHVLR